MSVTERCCHRISSGAGCVAPLDGAPVSFVPLFGRRPWRILLVLQPRWRSVDNVAVRVRLLGSFDVEGVPERRLGSRKGRTLLKVLALARGVPVSVDRIADVLWGDDQPARPADQVGVLASRLRGVLGAERIARSDAGYSLVADWLDVEELVDLAAVSAEALATGRLGAARAAADAALALVRGPLLPDLDGAWIESERAAVQAVITRVRRLAVDAAAAAGDHGAAAGLAEQALALTTGGAPERGSVSGTKPIRGARVVSEVPCPIAH